MEKPANSMMPEELVQALGILETPKFLGTKDSSNTPNVSFITTWTVYDRTRLVYGDFLSWKTKQNLESGNRQIGILVMTTKLDSWMIRADFESFHKNDAVYEFIAQTPLFRYNQYTNARGAGLADPVWVSPNYKISKVSVLTSFLKARRAAGKIPLVETAEGNMPPNVHERFAKMTSVKALCYIADDGYPIVFPAMGMTATSKNRLVMDRGEERKRNLTIEDGQQVAINLVTMEPAVFQVKGVFREVNDKTAYVELDSVYAGSLPRPGVRVDIPLAKREAD